jgi:hypothetical protein
MPLMWDAVRNYLKRHARRSNQEKQLVEALVPSAVPGKEYNEVASLVFVEADVAISVFHFEKPEPTTCGTFSSGALFIFVVPYIMMATLVYGSRSHRVSLCRRYFPVLRLDDSLATCCTNSIIQGTFADSGNLCIDGSCCGAGRHGADDDFLDVILLEATGTCNMCFHSC